MNSTKEQKTTLCKMQSPDGTIKIIRIVLPTSINQSPEKVDEFLKKINSENTFVALSSSEAIEFAVSCHRENEELKKELKSLKEALNDVKKIVMAQDQNKPQKDQETDSKSDNPNAYKFERCSKKAKLEDQSEQIQKLNLIIKELKKDVQKQTQMIKNVNEVNLKLCQENSDLKYGGQ